MKLSLKPLKVVNLGDIQDEATAEAFRAVLRLLEEMQKNEAVTINFNEITNVSQNSQPSVEDNRVMLWEDADAAVGQPKAYLVASMNSVTYTFASVQLA